jgi:hypothetical protein
MQILPSRKGWILCSLCREPEGTGELLFEMPQESEGNTMTIPEKVKIAGLTYNIKPVDIVDEDNHNTDGKILYTQGEIRLKNSLSPDYAQCALLHEIMHGIFFACNLKQDENVIDRISSMLYAVIVDNPQLFRE